MHYSFYPDNYITFISLQQTRQFKIMKTVTLKTLQAGQIFVFGGTLFMVSLTETKKGELIMCSIFASNTAYVYIADHSLVQVLN